MSHRTFSGCPHALRPLLLAAATALLLCATAGSASASVEWRVDSVSPSTVAPGGELEYVAELTNVGDSATDGSEISLLVELPDGLTAISGTFVLLFLDPPVGIPCTAADGGEILGATEVKCAAPVEFQGRESKRVRLLTEASPSASGTLLAELTVSGGGATESASTVDPVVVSSAPPEFGIDAFDAQLRDSSGQPALQAGAHPHDVSVSLDFNTYHNPVPLAGMSWPVEPARDAWVDLPPGLVGNPAALRQCSADQLANGFELDAKPLCPTASQVGTVMVRLGSKVGVSFGPLPVFNMVPPPGSAARFGFNVLANLVSLDAKLRLDGSYGLAVGSPNINEALPILGSTTTFWGAPADEAHRPERACPGNNFPFHGSSPGPDCPSGGADVAFLRNPTSCTGKALPWSAHADSWLDPGAFDERGLPRLGDSAWKSASLGSHQLPGYPHAPGEWGAEKALEGCENVPFDASLSARPTSRDVGTSSGLTVHLEVPNPGLEAPTVLADSDLKAAKVVLPQGLTVNPSQAEGLGACAPAQLDSTRLSFYPTDAGCPEDSKIGTVEVKTQLLDETIPGDVYIAQPYDNPFGSLLALYIVLAEPQRGILIKLPGKVETDPQTGQITTTFQDLPQLPFESFDFKFREGARAPLVTPEACGDYVTESILTPWANPDEPVVSESSFRVDRGLGGGPCPTGDLPPFKPGLLAGTVNNRAGSYSPFNLRLFRTDAEQQFTHFSIKLPPGVIGKLAGLEYCPDAAIEAAKGKSGAQELASPSCPESSYVGRTMVGAGVGAVQTYVPGKIYLAGPYNGSQLSIAAITAAKVGPFDLGTVVVRQALRIDPKTAEVFVDATGSDPLPHIIEGIPTKLRDIRAYVDRPEFVLNPTSCDETSTASTLLGSGLDFSSAHDDLPVTVTTRFQAADCGSLAFKPRLRLFTEGASKRAGNPRFKAVLTMRPGEANIAKAQVTLPRSAFLDQSHIRTICTRVQYAADTCPAGSIYGHARAITPLLDTPIEGPVYLRSSEHKLPDLVAKLRNGQIQIDLVGRIDSVGKDGRIRNTFEAVPDAPVSRFVLRMQGGKKGLLLNSTNLCRMRNRAISKFDGQNGKVWDTQPSVVHDCKHRKKGRR